MPPCEPGLGGCQPLGSRFTSLQTLFEPQQIAPSEGLATAGILAEERAQSNPPGRAGPGGSRRRLRPWGSSSSKTFASPGAFCSLELVREAARGIAAILTKQAVASCSLEIVLYFTLRIFRCTVKPCGLPKPKNPQPQLVPVLPNSKKLWL